MNVSGFTFATQPIVTRAIYPLYMEAGTICETGETGENTVVIDLF
jgi:hypothetical protein